MPDDGRRPARLQGRSAAAAAGTTHPCICLWLGMLAKESWIAQEHDREDGIHGSHGHDRSFLLVVRCTEASHESGTDGHSSRLHVLWRRISGCLEDLGSPDLTRYVRSGTGQGGNLRTLDRVGGWRFAGSAGTARLQVQRG
jgi:hypothetical protein